MYKIELIISIIIIFAALPSISIAEPVIWTSGDYEIRTNSEWYHIIELQTYNDVTVKMYEGTSVNSFSMYVNSELTKYDGSIVNLYLYDNAMALLLGGTVPMTIYSDPASTGWVKFYATNVSYSQTEINGNWLSDGKYFQIDFTGDTYSHVQIVPEPTTLALLALGSLVIFRRRV